MTTLKLALLRSTRAKNGTYKIRIAIGHKSETHYIVTKYTVNSPSEFQDGVPFKQASRPTAHARYDLPHPVFPVMSMFSALSMKLQSASLESVSLLILCSAEQITPSTVLS